MTAPGGRRWSAFRQQVFRLYGRVCHICGHDGSNQVDHIIPVAVAPQLAWSLANCRPAHGVPGNKCPTCGRACNQARQAGVVRPNAILEQAATRTKRKPAPVPTVAAPQVEPDKPLPPGNWTATNPIDPKHAPPGTAWWLVWHICHGGDNQAKWPCRYYRGHGAHEPGNTGQCW